MIKKIKNNDIVSHTWCGQEMVSGTYYEIQVQEALVWANDSTLIVDIANEIALVNDGTEDILDINLAIEYLKSDIPKEIYGEVTPKDKKNEHCMEPWGAEALEFSTKGDVETGDYVCAITLSNKSEDGLTFTYNSDCSIVPSIGNYVFQKNGTKRSWVTSLDTENHTLTFEMPSLSNGTGVYSRGAYLDCIVRDWKPVMYLWGMTSSVLKYSGDNLVPIKSEFIELSVVDLYDLFKTDEVCQALFGVDAVDADPYMLAMGFEINGEFSSHWTKYYDEGFLINYNNKYVEATDGSPGELMPNLWLRHSFFATENSTLNYQIFDDYFPTSK